MTLLLALATTRMAALGGTLMHVSHDPFTNAASQHRTEVEPDVFAYGQTIVSAFQAGRIYAAGSADIGWATSHDGGLTWNHGFLPGITTSQNAANPFPAVSDPAVAYDAAHRHWMISSLPVTDNGTAPSVVVSLSSFGGYWSNPVGVGPATTSADKDWIACDDTPTSAYYGHCYVTWDRPASGYVLLSSTSSDGGLTWSAPLPTMHGDAGLGGQPLAQPNGTVVVPYLGTDGIFAYRSTNGGATWSGAVKVADVFKAFDPAGIRANPLPSASIDASGRIFVAWEDCRFRPSCSSNDIVYAVSGDGITWSAPVRVPIDPLTSTIDHFDPGFGIERSSSGASTTIGLTFYFFSNTSCTLATCALGVGFVSSTDGGLAWSAPRTLAGAMSVAWLPQTSSGPMVGDYLATAFVNNVAESVFAVAHAPVAGVFDEAMYAPVGGLSTARVGVPLFTSVYDVAHPDPRHLYHWKPIPPKAFRARDI